MSLTEQDSRGFPEPPLDDWGDGPASYAPGERPTTPGDRTPPQDMAAEQSVLGAMLISKDAIADVTETIRGVDFYRPSHETIFDAIIDLYGRGEPVDMVTVAAELQRRGELQRIGGAPYLHTLSANVPIAANAGYYAEIVRETAILRRLVDAGTKIVQIGYAGEGQVDDIVDQAQAEVYKITDKRSSEDYAPLSDIMDGVLDEIEAISNREAGLYGVPTGFADLDDLTNGLHAGQMIIVAARPAMGKSTVALDFCRAASIHNNLTSAFFSLEMTRSEITMRLLSAEAKVPLNHIRNGNMGDEDWAKLARKMGEVSSAPMFIDDSPNMTMMEIRAKARRLKQRHDLKLMVIDYLQLMTSGKKVESRQLEVSEFSRQIKLLAKELEIPIIALSQLNRGPEQRGDKRPMMSDLRESGCLTADTRLMRAADNTEITLGELMESGARDIPVWSLDDRLKLVPRTLTHAFPSGRKPVYELTLASGRRIAATGNHKFLTYDGWVPLLELSPGSRIGSVRHVPPPLEITRRDEDEVVLLAHLLGDGSFVRRQPLRYASVDEANLTAVADAARSRFGIRAVRDEYAAARVTTLRLPSPYRLTHGKRNPVAAWLDEDGLFGLRSHEKFVPGWVFGLPKDQVGLFLRHLWATDGCVFFDEQRRLGRVYYASTSRRLVDDVARLLLRFNVFTRIKRTRKAGYRDGWHLHVYGVENQLRFLDDIGVHGARGERARVLAEAIRGVRGNTNLDTIPTEVWEDVRGILAEQGMSHRAFAAAMGTQFGGSSTWKHAPSRQRLSRVAAVLNDADLEVLATNDVFWDTVASIELVGEQDVYDATVMGTHNFVVEGIAAHNSIEQDADMVILLHRDDVYEKESTRPGEADLIVAKHRNGPTRDITVAFQGHYSRFVDMAH
ncbi:replicative DNA helicase [Nocardioides sp. YIM 152315]|uniref:replicative DNA helicase n=1 Tax=Nocardioides sp. YIM 152315 TaxID=3031760 RepID=UPI0023D9D040|nr:replicative DNA helicase [Nocardioides sp. YIM 152315]MDF1604419.1 replicative DNA helicase [Nocardioides sp. YIM 152315]